jgi:chromate transport protein ChrA
MVTGIDAVSSLTFDLVKSPPSPRALARAWFDIGTQSVGGGTSTLFMIRWVLVKRHGWITLREFTEAWALSQLSPGSTSSPSPDCSGG